MKTTIYETNNPFSTFALRGGRLRKRGRGVVSYAPFLIGAVSTVILGSMLALSTPSFANEGDEEEIMDCSNMDSSVVATVGTSTTNYTGVFLDSSITVTGRQDMDMATGRNMKSSVMETDYYSDDSHSFYTGNTGFHKTMITTSGTVSGNGENTGVRFYRTGDGTICVGSNANISGAGYGISASHDSMGVLGISNEGAITNVMRDGISAIRAGNGNIEISSSTGAISANVTGIYAKHVNEGGVEIENSSGITVTGNNVNTKANGIEVKHTGDGDVDVENFAGIDAKDDGIHVLHTGTGSRNIGITLKERSSISSGGNGIYAKRSGGSGGIAILLERGSSISNRGRPSPESRGIKVHHGGSGPIDIDILGGIATWGGKSVSVEREGSGKIDIDIGNGIRGDKHAVWVKHHSTGDVVISARNGSHIYGEWYSGVYVNHVGGGLIDINIERGAGYGGPGLSWGAGRGHAIQVINTGEHTIEIDVEGRVSSRRNRGIHATHNGTGDTNISVSGVVYSRDETSIRAHSTGGGSITTDVSGYVGGGSGRSIKMESSGTKILILRPGFRLSGTVVSSGTGEGILELSARKPGVAPNATPNTVNLGGFSDFRTFLKSDGNAWTVTGTSSSMFEKAEVTGGTLNFSDATFRMSEGNFFIVRDGGDLRVTGSSVLEGNLNNGGEGKITFGSGGELEVKGNYQGSGELIFEIDDGADEWDAQGLTIIGRIIGAQLKRPVFISISENAGLQLGLSNSPWLVEQKLPEDVRRPFRNRLRDFGFGGVKVAGEVKNELVKTVTRDDGQQEDEITIGTNIYVFDHDDDVATRTNRWRLRWKKIDQSASPPVNLPRVPIRPPEVREEPGGSGEGLGFRDDVRRHAGGLWAERSNLRTLQEAGGVADGRLRTEDSGVRFGFDLPARGFMGGDVVLGAGVWQGLSVSDISSSEGESVIGLESHAAVLTASWWSPTGFYLDGQTQYVRFSSDISADGLSLVQDNEGTGMGVSSELGYRSAVSLGGMDLEIVPQVQLAWSRVGFEDYIGPRGGLIVLEDGELMTGRLGLSWAGEWRDIGGSGRVYGGASLHNPLDGRTAVRATGVLLTSKQSSSVDGRLGLSYEWDDGYSIYGEAKAFRQGDVEEVSANLGMRVDF